MRTHTLRAEPLEGRDVPAPLAALAALPATPTPLFGVGVDSGGPPHVRVYTGAGQELYSFFAFDQAFLGGVRVATADFTGDGFEDIAVGAGPGAGPHVRMWDGRTGEELQSFFAFADGFTGGVFLGTGDVTADGTRDLIVGAGPGGPPHVKVYGGATGTEVRSFIAPGLENLRGGAYVAGGDVTGDGVADIAVGTGRFNPAFINVYDGSTLQLLRSFNGYDGDEADDFDFGELGFGAEGAARAAGADRFDEVVEGIYFATMADLDGDGDLDLPTGRVLGDPELRIFDTGSNNGGDDDDDADDLFDDSDDDVRGLRPIGKDLNGDGVAELIVGAGPGSSEVVVRDGRSGDELYRLSPFGGFNGGVVVG